jgi:phosphodiesterase/alkaline phosphatase D-like protein
MNNEINNVVLTGDIHTSWANDLPSEDYFLTGAGSVGVNSSRQVSLLQDYQA